MEIFKNKKFYLIGLGIFFTGFFLFVSTSSVSAASCEKNQESFSFASFLNPVASLAEKVVKNFGYQISLAAAPDPDFCGSDSVACSGTTPTATINWESAPANVTYDCLCQWGEGNWYCQGTAACPLHHYILTVGGSDYQTTAASYAVSSGLVNSTTYNWSVKAYYPDGASDNCVCSSTYVRQNPDNNPYGSFTTLNCAPPPPPPGDFSLSLGGSVACNSVPLSWTSSSGADGYRILRGSPRVDISPYQPYTALNFTDTTVSQNTSYIYQIEAYNNAGTNRSNSLNVTTPYCPPPPPPPPSAVTVDIKANGSDGPISITYNTAATLSWTSTNATACTASNGWSGSKPTSGSESTGNLTSSKTYALTCTGPGGSISDSVLINVGASSLSVSLTAAPNSGVAPLNNVVLTADVSGSAISTINYTFYCNRSDSGTNITPGWAHKLDGTNNDPYSAPADVCNSVYQNPGAYTAKVIVERDSLAAEAKTTVTVNAPPTVTLTSWPIFTIPELVSLYWSSTNADSRTASGDWSGNKAVQGEEHFSKPRGNYTFTLTATGPGGSISETVNSQVIQVPSCSFTASPSSIIPPQTSILSWSCAYADTCSIDQGIGSVNVNSGTKNVQPLKTTTYTLSCDGLDGSHSSPATVTISFILQLKEVTPQ